MARASWSLQDAKNKLSAVVDAARRGEPQLVTRHGKPAAVVVSAEEYERLQELDKAVAPSFADLLLAMPQDDGTFGTPGMEPRDVDL